MARDRVATPRRPQAIAQERSFHAAAARLGYSQSAVSQQVATLERIIGGG